MKTEWTVPIVLAVVILIVVAGFYIAFDKIAALSTEVRNMELTLELQNKGNPLPAPIPAPEEPAEKPKVNATSSIPKPETALIIPAAIIFTTPSSAVLSPQAPIAVTVEEVAKERDGKIRVSLKMFTAEASSYTALDPKEIIQILNVDGEVEFAAAVSGQFHSMPPKSSVSGTMTFNPSKDGATVILQIGVGDDIKFYEFNFNTKSYKETAVG